VNSNYAKGNLMTRPVRTTLVIIAALAVALLAAGCAPDEDEATTTTGTPSASVAGEQIDVSLSEFSIDMPTSISAGPAAFVVINDGSVEHNFEVEGEGIEEEFDENLAPGESGTLELQLEPGTYEIYCPVANHADEGMRLEFEVTES
jgi:uncharacterized cupredoxin-like copper-binding protein